MCDDGGDGVHGRQMRILMLSRRTDSHLYTWHLITISMDASVF